MEVFPYFDFGRSIAGASPDCAFAKWILIHMTRVRSDGKSPILVPGRVWALAAHQGGILPVIGYWLVHYSPLRSLTQSTGNGAGRH